MSQLDDLLARSRSPGSFVERRKFTLSREKAIEKQREFALRHPNQYVLELVQAAVFAGATYLAIDAQPSRLLVAWVGGSPFQQRDLANLLDYLFADRTDPTTRHLVQLAVGVNALLQRRPHTLRIESGDGKSSVRVDLDQQGSGSLGQVTDPIAGTYLYADFGGSWFKRFMGPAHAPEQALVEERCLYTPVPILLNGRAPFGYRGTRHIEVFGAREQVHFDEHGRRGVVAQHHDPKVTGYRMVVGGVWISTLALPDVASAPMVGVLCDDGLRKTADHGDIVQDWRLAKLVHAVQPHATALIRRTHPRYEPPALPRVDEPVAQPATGPANLRPAAEPLRDPILALPPRAPTTLDALRAQGLSRPESPLFWCTADVAGEALGHHADPHRFPYPVLILTPGQAVTLEQHLPRVPLHRITSRADVDFVRRASERRARTRSHRFRHREAEVELVLHLEGERPAWGNPAGVPWCVVDGDQTRAAGDVRGVKVHVATEGHEGDAPTLSAPLELPSTSVVVRGRHGVPDDALVERILTEAWRLAAPETGEPHRPLLAALLGQVAVPRLLASGRGSGLSLPVAHPDSLLTAPLARKADGGLLTLAELAALQGTDDVVEIVDPQELRALLALEQRLGFGHLAHAELAARPAWAVGFAGSRWTWLANRKAWQGPLTQVIFVGSTLRPRLGDQDWHTVAHPHPVVVHAVRHGADPEQAEAGWDLLYHQLLRLETADAWERDPHPHGLNGARARGLGRLALYHLAARHHPDDPLLLPTDGGARWSVAELRRDRRARLVARHGVQLSEPRTFPASTDERRALEADGPALVLRYDDAPEVWTSLTRDDTGWLLRQQVRDGGITGWLGLRHPYDATTGLLVRATGRLVGIPDLDRRIPCHGLLWPEGEARVPTRDQEQILQLAGLAMYQALVEVLDTERDPERLATARAYGAAFALRSAAEGGRASATARELARRIEVRDASGAPWGTLESWLATPNDGRPSLPAPLQALVPDGAAPVLAAAEPEAPGEAWLQDRLRAALAREDLGVHVGVVHQPGGHAVALLPSRSSRDHAALGVNADHRLGAAATAGHARARELLALECARVTCGWFAAVGQDVDLAQVQRKLVAQRLGGA